MPKALQGYHAPHQLRTILLITPPPKDRRTEMNTQPRSLAATLFPIGLLLIAMASIQSGASLAKSMFPIIGAQGTTALRLIFASIIMLLILRPWRVRMTANTLRNVVIYGMALGGMNFLFYMALQTVPIGIAVALEFTGPLAVAIFSSRRPIDFLWIALAIAGLLLLLPAGQSGQALDPAGAAYALGAGVCWALYSSGNVPGPNTASRAPRSAWWSLHCSSPPSALSTRAVRCSRPRSSPWRWAWRYCPQHCPTAWRWLPSRAFRLAPSAP